MSERAAAERAGSVIATGSVRLAAGARIEVGAQISGRVRSLKVTQGSQVVAGQIIAQLDTQETRAQLDQAAAQVAELTAASALASGEAQRLEALAPSGGVTQQEIVAARAAAAQSAARLDAARATLDLAQIRLSYTVVRAPINGVVASVTTHEGEAVSASLAAPTFVSETVPTRRPVAENTSHG